MMHLAVIQTVTGTKFPKQESEFSVCSGAEYSAMPKSDCNCFCGFSKHYWMKREDKYKEFLSQF